MPAPKTIAVRLTYEELAHIEAALSGYSEDRTGTDDTRGLDSACTKISSAWVRLEKPATPDAPVDELLPASWRKPA